MVQFHSRVDPTGRRMAAVQSIFSVYSVFSVLDSFPTVNGVASLFSQTQKGSKSTALASREEDIINTGIGGGYRWVNNSARLMCNS